MFVRTMICKCRRRRWTLRFCPSFIANHNSRLSRLIRTIDRQRRRLGTEYLHRSQLRQYCEGFGRQRWGSMINTPQLVQVSEDGKGRPTMMKQAINEVRNAIWWYRRQNIAYIQFFKYHALRISERMEIDGCTAIFFLRLGVFHV